MKTKHTAGPWVICTGKGGSLVQIESREYVNDGQPIASFKGPDRSANAILIASAPELLEALKEAKFHLTQLLLDISHEKNIPYEALPAHLRKPIALAEKAIAKAEGNS